MRIDDGEMQVGSLIAFLSYFMQILMAVLMVTIILVMLPRAVGVRRTHHRGAVDASRDQQPASIPRGRTTVAGEIRIEAATFRYPGADRPVLQGCLADRATGNHHRRGRARRARASRR